MQKRAWVLFMTLLMLFAFSAMAANPSKKLVAEKQQESQQQGMTVSVGHAPNTAMHHQINELDETVQIYSTTFDDVTDWSMTDNNSSGYAWQQVTSTGRSIPLDDTAPCMFIDSDDIGFTAINTDLISPVITPTANPYITLVWDDYYHRYSSDSATVDISTDGGSTWTTLVDLVAAGTNDYAFPHVIDISAEATGDFQIRFHYEANYAWYWGVDNFTIYGSDAVMDLTPPVVSVDNPPTFSFPGQDRTILATATDDIALDNVMLHYGILSDTNVVSEDSVAMTLTGNPDNADEYSGVIPGTFGAQGDTVVYYVKATDTSSNVARDPLSDSDWFGMTIYPATFNYSWLQMDDFSWVDISGTGTDLALGDDEAVTINFVDYGVDSLNWYGVNYGSLTVSSNGWISLVENISSSPYSPTLPSTSTPNGTIALCGSDLNPSRDGSGQVYVGSQDGKLIVEYNETYFYDWTGTANFGPKMEAILDPATGQVAVNYDLITFAQFDSTFTKTHAIGYESGDGVLGETIYYGSDFITPADSSSFLITPPVGTVEGYVYSTSDSSIIADAEVTLYNSDMSAVLATTTSDTDGFYSFNAAPTGTVTVQAIAAGFQDTTYTDVSVEMMTTTTLDLYMEPETILTPIEGYVYDADAADPNTPVAGMTVHLVQLDLDATTDADGFFSFGDQVIGTYAFHIFSDPIGADGYHDVTYSGQVIVDNNPDLMFNVYEVLPPSNVTGTSGNMTITVSWDLPANNVDVATAMRRAGAIRADLAHLGQKQNVPEGYADQLRAELAQLEGVINRHQGSELDEMSDLQGYRIMMDGTELDTLVNGTIFSADSLVNGQFYDFQVAADYGYGEDYLVWSEAVTVRPLEIVANYETVDYTWVEIDPDSGGTGTALDLSDDGESGGLPIGGTFFLYGMGFDQIVVGSNGAMSFDPGSDISFSNPTIPNTNTPNNIVAPFWDDLVSDNTVGENQWYYSDTENNRFIVEWYTHRFFQDIQLKFEAVFNFDDNTIFFSYDTTMQDSGGWQDPVLSPTIGVEDNTGTVGLSIPPSELANQTTFQISFQQVILSSVEGTVQACDENGVPIEGVQVWSSASENMLGTTDADGNFSVMTPVGTQLFTFRSPDYWPVEVADVNVVDGTTTTMDPVYMTRPDVSVSPTTVNMTYNLDSTQVVSSDLELSNTGCGEMQYRAMVQILDDGGNVVAEYPQTPVTPKSVFNGDRQNSSKSGRFDRELPHGPVTGELNEVWDNLLNFSGYDLTDDLYLYGAAMMDDGIYLTNSATPYELYHISSDGTTLIGTAAFPDDGDDYYNELASNPVTGMMYMVSSSGELWEFNGDLSVMNDLGSIGFDAWALALDWYNNMLYAYTPAVDPDPAQFVSVDLNTMNITTLASPDDAFGGFGPDALAFMPNDANGYTVWGMFNFDAGDYVYGYNPNMDAWDTNNGSSVYPSGDICSGIEPTLANDPARVDMVTLEYMSGDVDVWEGLPMQQWLTISPAEGTVAAGEATTLTVTVDPTLDDTFNPVSGQTAMANIIISGPYIGQVQLLCNVDFVSGVGDNVADLPTKYALHQNYPNPFNPTTQIKFDLVKAQTVHLTVYNMLGQQVARLVDGQKMEAGFHAVSFDGSRLASGVYFYRIEAGNFTSLKKMVLVK